MSGPATSPDAEARRQPPRKTATQMRSARSRTARPPSVRAQVRRGLRHTSCESQSEKAKHHGQSRDIPSQIGKLRP
eukprot:scaffold34643_cov62-Phaeocystis_antarctica.AAC.19